MEAKLIVISGKANKNEVALKLPCTIGRSREADLTIGHPMVSRQHCELSESDGEVLIRDLGSLNGTFVNGERVSESRLDPSAEVTVGPLTFRVDFESAAPAEAEDVAFEAVDGESLEEPAAPAASADVADTADFSDLLNADKAEAPAAKKPAEDSGEDTDFFDAIDADSPPAVPSSAGAYDVGEEEAEEEEEAEPTPPPPSGAKARITGKGGVKDDRASSAQPVKPRANAEDDYGVASESAEGDEADEAEDEAADDETVPQKAAKDDAKKQKKGWWPFAGKGKAEKKGAEKPAEESEEEPAANVEPKPAAKAATKPAAKAASKPAAKTPAKPAAKGKPGKKSDEDLAFEALLDDGDSENGDASLGFLKND